MHTSVTPPSTPFMKQNCMPPVCIADLDRPETTISGLNARLPAMGHRQLYKTRIPKTEKRGMRPTSAPPSRRTFTERRTSSKKAYHASYTQNAFANKRPSSAGCIPIGELVNPPEHAATYETGHCADASANRGPCHTNSRTKHASTDHVCGRSHPRLPTGTAILGGVRRFRLWTFFKLGLRGSVWVQSGVFG